MEAITAFNLVCSTYFMVQTVVNVVFMIAIIKLTNEIGALKSKKK